MSDQGTVTVVFGGILTLISLFGFLFCYLENTTEQLKKLIMLFILSFIICLIGTVV